MEKEGANSPDIALSYLDEKIYYCLGHFQKEFDSEWSAKNLDAQFGGYGTFLATQLRPPSGFFARDVPQILQALATASPSKVQSGDLSIKHLNQGPQLCSSPIAKNPARDGDLIESGKGGDQRPMKVATKMMNTKENVPLHNGLAHDDSSSTPFRSAHESGTPFRSSHESGGFQPLIVESIHASSSYILKVMTSLPIHFRENVSPLNDNLLLFLTKDVVPKKNERAENVKVGSGKSSPSADQPVTVQGDAMLSNLKRTKSDTGNKNPEKQGSSMMLDSKTTMSERQNVKKGILHDEASPKSHFSCTNNVHEKPRKNVPKVPEVIGKTNNSDKETQVKSTSDHDYDTEEHRVSVTKLADDNGGSPPLPLESSHETSYILKVMAFMPVSCSDLASPLNDDLLYLRVVPKNNVSAENMEGNSQTSCVSADQLVTVKGDPVPPKLKTKKSNKGIKNPVEVKKGSSMLENKMTISEKQKVKNEDLHEVASMRHNLGKTSFSKTENISGKPIRNAAMASEVIGGAKKTNARRKSSVNTVNETQVKPTSVPVYDTEVKKWQKITTDEMLHGEVNLHHNLEKSSFSSTDNSEKPRKNAAKASEVIEEAKNINVRRRINVNPVKETQVKQSSGPDYDTEVKKWQKNMTDEMPHDEASLHHNLGKSSFSSTDNSKKPRKNVAKASEVIDEAKNIDVRRRISVNPVKETQVKQSSGPDYDTEVKKWQKNTTDEMPHDEASLHHNSGKSSFSSTDNSKKPRKNAAKASEVIDEAKNIDVRRRISVNPVKETQVKQSSGPDYDTEVKKWQKNTTDEMPHDEASLYHNSGKTSFSSTTNVGKPKKNATKASEVGGEAKNIKVRRKISANPVKETQVIPTYNLGYDIEEQKRQKITTDEMLHVESNLHHNIRKSPFSSPENMSGKPKRNADMASEVIGEAKNIQLRRKTSVDPVKETQVKLIFNPDYDTEVEKMQKVTKDEMLIDTASLPRNIGKTSVSSTNNIGMPVENVANASEVIGVAKNIKVRRKTSVNLVKETWMKPTSNPDYDTKVKRGQKITTGEMLHDDASLHHFGKTSFSSTENIGKPKQNVAKASEAIGEAKNINVRRKTGVNPIKKTQVKPASGPNYNIEVKKRQTNTTDDMLHDEASLHHNLGKTSFPSTNNIRNPRKNDAKASEVIGETKNIKVIRKTIVNPFKETGVKSTSSNDYESEVKKWQNITTMKTGENGVSVARVATTVDAKETRIGKDDDIYVLPKDRCHVVKNTEEPVTREVDCLKLKVSGESRIHGKIDTNLPFQSEKSLVGMKRKAKGYQSDDKGNIIGKYQQRLDSREINTSGVINNLNIDDNGSILGKYKQRSDCREINTDGVISNLNIDDNGSILGKYKQRSDCREINTDGVISNLNIGDKKPSKEDIKRTFNQVEFEASKRTRIADVNSGAKLGNPDIKVISKANSSIEQSSSKEVKQLGDKPIVTVKKLNKQGKVSTDCTSMSLKESRSLNKRKLKGFEDTQIDGELHHQSMQDNKLRAEVNDQHMLKKQKTFGFFRYCDRQYN